MEKKIAWIEGRNEDNNNLSDGTFATNKRAMNVYAQGVRVDAGLRRYLAGER